MTKVFLFTCLYMMCTISIAWGCVTGAGPSWEIGQPAGRGAGKSFKTAMRVAAVRPSWQIGQPAGKRFPRPVMPAMRVAAVRPLSVPTRPSIPDEVMRYFNGMIGKESAFASIDLDGNGQVSFVEWILEGGAMTEFNHMLLRLDTNGDNLISLAELQPFSLPARPNIGTLPRDLTRDSPPDSPPDSPADSPHPDYSWSSMDMNLPRDMPRDLPRDLTPDSPPDSPADSPRHSPRLSPHPDYSSWSSMDMNLPRDMPRDLPRDLTRDSPPDSPPDSPADSPRPDYSWSSMDY